MNEERKCNVDIYPPIKKKKILPVSTTWMDLEGIMLSETNQRKKTTYDLIYICNLKAKSKFRDSE